MNGKIIHLNEQKQIGKILGDDGRIYYLHHSKVLNAQFDSLFAGLKVTFDPLPSDGRFANGSALGIKVINCVEEEFYIGVNPFIPDKPILDPYFFAGRRSRLLEGVTHLVNNKNIMITGERGIGKSSLANQLVLIAEGNLTLPYKYNFRLAKELDFKSISIKISKEETLVSFSQKVIQEFVRKYNLDRSILISHEINLDFYKAVITPNTPKYQDEEIISIFNYNVISLLDIIPTKCGVLIFIDEFENMNEQIEFAQFIKNATEYFSFEKRNVCFIIAGIPSAATTQFRNHASFLRLFMPVELEILSPSESYDLINSYLRLTKKRINEGVLESISRMSSGLPLNLQSLGYYTYQIDTDNFIKSDDLFAAVTFLITSIKKIEYQTKHENIGFGFNEELLSYIIKNKIDKTIDVYDLAVIFSKSSTDIINSALEFFVKNELLIKQAKGKFYIKDRLFVEYLRRYYKE